MTGLEQFLSIFGNVTIAQIVFFGFAIFFCWRIYKAIDKFLKNKKKLLIEKHEAEQEKEAQLKNVLAEVNKYPEYRAQSRAIQQDFQNQINSLKDSQERLEEVQKETLESLNTLKANMEKREKNKLQDKLLQSYRYYTDKEKNPEQTWSPMESQAFWALFSDYEDVGGNGYIHSVVMPAMKLLKVIEKE